MSRYLSPKKVALAIGVSESSLKRWCDKGALEFNRTAGGHRRIPVGSVLRFLRDSKHALKDPAVIGLPGEVGRSRPDLATAEQAYMDAALKGQEETCRTILIDVYLAGFSAAQIFDEMITPAFHRIGEKFECDEIEIYQERRACEITRHLFTEFRGFLPQPVEFSQTNDQPRLTAMGGTPPGDTYALPTSMVEIVLMQSGWVAESLGCSLPAETLIAAAHEHQPRLFWLSVSHLENEDAFVDAFHDLSDRLPAGTALVVGGRALTSSIRSKLKYSAFCDNLQQLENFARTLQP